MIPRKQTKETATIFKISLDKSRHGGDETEVELLRELSILEAVVRVRNV